VARLGHERDQRIPVDGKPLCYDGRGSGEEARSVQETGGMILGQAIRYLTIASLIGIGGSLAWYNFVGDGPIAAYGFIGSFVLWGAMVVIALVRYQLSKR
jgi:hypothetical protein